MKKSPFKNSGNSRGEGGVIKDPLGTENPGGWGGGCKSKCLPWDGYGYFLEPHNLRMVWLLKQTPLFFSLRS